MLVTQNPPRFFALQWTGSNLADFQSGLTDVTAIVSGDSLILLNGGTALTVPSSSWVVAPDGQRTLTVSVVFDNDSFAASYTAVA